MRTQAALLETIPGKYEICDVDIDPPRAHEVLVRYVASGICHSDVHILTGEHPSVIPMCGGHEGAGIVEEVGPGVSTLAPGDHVVASFIPSCGRCRYCAAGRANLCNSAPSCSSVHSWTVRTGCTPTADRSASFC